LTLQKGKPARINKYWDLSFDKVDNQVSERQWCERIVAKLEEAVKIRLISEVPLGAFLSGGIDSSAVVALMTGLSETPVKTSSIGFNDNQFNELPYANQIVSRYGTDHNQETVTGDAVDMLDKLVWFYDEPFADSSAIPTYLVSKITRKRVTVALSGDGGDENFAGYRRYYFDLLENRLRAFFPAKFRRTVLAAMAMAYPKVDWAPQIFRAKTLLSNLALTPTQGFFNSMSWFGTDKKRILSKQLLRELTGYDVENLFSTISVECQSQDPLTRVQYLDVKTYLVDDILTKVDRASMANSLEVRVPLLDHEFMEMVATIPSHLKLHGKEGKYILKKALQPMLPKSTLYRTKMGFSIPLAKWLRNGFKDIFKNNVLSERGFCSSYLNYRLINKLWSDHQKGRINHAVELWALLILELWGRRWT
jgi:asparagine synthase (glutamine-hydrolysing)